MGVPIKEMHSRKSQGYRTRVSEEFRAGSGVIMFSSDVSARGVDYPDVSLVVQVSVLGVRPGHKDMSHFI
jgi:ATP-dependent RNA helicase MSS116